jgi:hypothetical protein
VCLSHGFRCVRLAANFADVSSVVNRFRSTPQAQPVVRCDFRPAVPDYVVDFTDVSCTLDAFSGIAYPYQAQAIRP